MVAILHGLNVRRLIGLNDPDDPVKPPTLDQLRDERAEAEARRARAKAKDRIAEIAAELLQPEIATDLGRVENRHEERRVLELSIGVSERQIAELDKAIAAKEAADKEAELDRIVAEAPKRRPLAKAALAKVEKSRDAYLASLAELAAVESAHSADNWTVTTAGRPALQVLFPGLDDPGEIEPEHEEPIYEVSYTHEKSRGIYNLYDEPEMVEVWRDLPEDEPVPPGARKTDRTRIVSEKVIRYPRWFASPVHTTTIAGHWPKPQS